jgi:hypothetical protein
MSTQYGLPENVEDVQYMAEGTRGTFSTGTTAVFIGQSPQLAFGSSIGSWRNAVAGSRDPSEAGASVQTLALNLSFGTIVNKTLLFMKRGINLADGIATSMSMCLRETVGGTARYLKLKNALIGGGAFGVVGSGPVQGMVAIAGNLSAYDGSAPTNWVFASPTTGAYTGASGLANNVIVRDVDAAVTYTPSVRSWAVGFNNGIFPIPECGNEAFADFIPTTRGINVSLSVNKKDLYLWGIHNLRHDSNVTIIISSPGVTFTATGGLLDPANLTFATDSPNFEVYTHNSLTGSLVA